MSGHYFDVEAIEKQMKHIKGNPFRPDKWDVLTWFSEFIDGNEWNILFLRKEDGLIIMQQWQS